MKNYIHALIFTILPVMPIIAQGTPPATPIDGGLAILLAAGGIYGAKKLRDYRRDK